MSAIDFDTLTQLESASDPNGTLFKKMMADLLAVSDTVQPVTSVALREPTKDWTRVLPYCGSTVENRQLSESYPEFSVSDNPTYTQGVLSLAALFSRLIKIFSTATKTGVGRVLFVSSYARELCDMFKDSDPLVQSVDFTSLSTYKSLLGSKKYTVLVFDHTTVTTRLDLLLEHAYDAGIKVVEGVFYFSPAIDNGWSGVLGDERIMVQHNKDGVHVGPADDPTRILYYSRYMYKAFTDPSQWTGNAKSFFYELKSYGLLSQYTAMNIGSHVPDSVVFKVPVCSSPDMVMIVIDRKFANGIFSSTVSNDRMSIFSPKRDYVFEMRKKLFDDCVLFLIGKQKGTDIVSESIKYISAHNYSDLFEGSRVITAHSLSYTDALCAAVVCAIQAYTFRYSLTHDSIRALVTAKSHANAKGDMMLGVLSKLLWVLWRYTKHVAYELPTDALAKIKTSLATTDLIPGVCYDIYRDREYTIGGKWYETGIRRYYDHDYSGDVRDDAITSFMGGVKDASAADYLVDFEAMAELSINKPQQQPYQYNPVSEPIIKCQDVYDGIFPGNSIANLGNVAELRKTRDIDISMDFVGKIQVGLDNVRPETLHADMPIRTSALPVGRSGLLDSILASAKRNFSVPDMHNVTDVWSFGTKLVNEFVNRACVPGAHKICDAYRKTPVVCNVTAYNDWAAGKSEAYMKALLGDIPDELVELGFEKYTSILKARVKPKLTVAAQRELGQPQVVVHHTKVETAVYSGVFRKAFERFDSILKDEYKSAGRSSDQDITEWATKMAKVLLTSKLLEGDSSMYDKSQSLLAMVIEVSMLQMLGMSVEVIDSLKKSFVGSAHSRAAGLAFIIAMQRKSGHVDTMLGNLIYNFVSLGHCVGYDNILAMIAKGDDNLAALKPGVFTGDAAAVTAKKMGIYFNLETKIILHEVPAFSSGGFVPLGDVLLYFPDPVKLLELLGERVYGDEHLLLEKYESFRDRVQSYNHSGAPAAIQEWTRKRYKSDADIVGLIDSFFTIADSPDLFRSAKGYPAK